MVICGLVPVQAHHAGLGEQRAALEGRLERARAARAGQEARAAAPAASADALLAKVSFFIWPTYPCLSAACQRSIAECMQSGTGELGRKPF